MTNQEKLSLLFKEGHINKITHNKLQAKIESTYANEKIEYLWGKHKEQAVEEGTPISAILAPNLQTPPYGEADLDALNAGIDEGVEEDVHEDATAADGVEELAAPSEADKKKAASPKDSVKRPEPSDKR